MIPRSSFPSPEILDVGVCHQKKKRDEYLRLGSPDIDLDLKTARVRPVTRDFAKQIIMKYEWLGTMTSSTFHYGIFFGPFCAGVTCVCLGGVTSAVQAAKMLGINDNELAGLLRGACVHWAPKGANSKLLAWTVKFLRRDTPARILLAYADTDAGEIGTVYQAAGWDYIGKGISNLQFISPEGREYTNKLPYDICRKYGFKNFGKNRIGDITAKLLERGWTTKKSTAKHRYVVVMDQRDRLLRARIDQLKKPYPKRAAKA